MKFKKKKQIELTEEQKEEIRIKDFFDRILPSTIKFLTDHYIVGDSYRCVWAIKEYPPTTEELALFSQLADRNNLTVRLYSRLVDALEQRKIIQNATRKNKLSTGSNDAMENITAEGNLQDVVTLIAELRKNKEPLLHCAVYLELKAESMPKLRELQSDILMELTRSKMSIDRLTLRQKEGFLSVLPCGANMFKEQFERVLPASSVANLYPFNYSGKTDPKGFFIGRDKYGTNILVDFDRRAEDKTNANCLILGNSGQGKSYLMKLILTNLRESGKRIISLDPEAEYEELTNALGGCYIDFMSGEYIINPLEPKSFGEADKEYDQTTPEAFRRVTRLSQHIAYLKDFFRAYKDFNDEQLDTLEIILTKLYKNFGITDYTDYDKLSKTDYPIMSDLYELLEKEYKGYQHNQKNIYREKTLQELCLGLHSMCVGTESKYFNGHTNIVDDKFLCFGVKGLMDTNRRLKDAMLFNVLSYMTNELLGKGNTVAAIDELYLFLTNMTAIEYIRNASKRVRKKDSSVILASQNIEDFMLDGIREYTKPLFSIPTHQFLFNAGNIEPKVYIDTMQLEQSEFELIKYPERGTCLYRCGNERYLLQVIAPEFKQKMFGKAGGR
ncbi:ATP-binding protein [uncultured Eubacterium sp.]|uniref:VirB4 family type IV secretion system protein n=1 Tax=uncultured Eubacterium sp. TaxID=165185 RepID=UPI002804BC0C|nr:ATP-binding protein [uncultured Eubacterium sp.]